jgi:hypothetical protein
MKKIRIVVLVLFILAFMIIGCTSPSKKEKAWERVIPKKTSFVHMVQWPNETLPIIAKWYTGDSNNWQSLADANPIINPKQLSAGNKIFISEDLLKIRKTMPRKFITEYYKPKKKKLPSKSVKVPKKEAPVPSQPAPLPKKEDEFEIIGPK